jgi:hypothetical protein
MKPKRLALATTAVLIAFPFAANSRGATVVWKGAPIPFSKDALADFRQWPLSYSHSPSFNAVV